jgi:protein O-mannosyl-transferase
MGENGRHDFAGPQQPAPAGFRLNVLVPVVILSATFISYAGTLALGFVFDDHVLIVTNDSIRSWRYLPAYFTSHIWSFRYPHLLANYYRPLFLVWLRLNDMLFGLHPWGWHLTSVLAHLGVTYLVYRLCLRLTRDVWVAGTAGLLFGLHPVHAEAVADITSIQEPLSTLFILGALLAFCRSQESCSARWLSGSLLMSAAALLSKESGMVVPILIGAYAWTWGEVDGGEAAAQNLAVRFLHRFRAAAVASLPFWAVIVAYVPLRIHALKGFAHVVTPLSLAQVVFTIPSVLQFYLRLLVWPLGLSCYYDTPYVAGPAWHAFVQPMLLVVALFIALVGWWRWSASQGDREESNTILFAATLMVTTIIPVLNFRFLPEGEVAHDRYVYLPSVGFCILVALALRRVLVTALRARPGVASTSFAPAKPAVIVTLICAGGLGFATARQTLFWSDDLTLNFRAHQIAPHNVFATTSLAAALAQKGMDGPASALYQQALAIQPSFWRANVNLGYLYYAHGNYAEAARCFSRATAADPTDGDQFLYLGMSFLRIGRISEAETAIRTALLVRPLGKNYHLGLAMVLMQEGKYPEAKRELQAELEPDPQNAQARELLMQVEKKLQ